MSSSNWHKEIPLNRNSIQLKLLNRGEMLKRITIMLILLSLLLTACQEATPTKIPIEIVPTPSQATLLTSSALISEVLAGVDGNNNVEFIELYNPGITPYQLQDFSLWYRLPTSEEDLLVYQWLSPAFIPGHGHYLLVREGQDVGVMPNAEFTQGLNTGGGGLLLRDPEGVAADALGWGNAPDVFTEDQPAAILENGLSLERAPGGVEGNHQDTNNNAFDFQLSDTPQPQNSGSDPTPAIPQFISLTLDVPETVEPGSDFDILLTITNESDQILEDINATLYLPPELTIRSLPQSMEAEEQIVRWKIEELPVGALRSERLTLTTPWAYLDYSMEIFFAQVGGSDVTTFAPPAHTRTAGGTIPIGTARGLIGSELTVEGIATMYTGGSYAGSGNVKFYLEDETGGLQVYVVGGEGEVDIPIGALVRVKGSVELYRDSVELVPNVVPGDVEIISLTPDEATPLTQASIRQAAFDLETLPGRLVQVEGNVTRVEEFSYSYEIDLVDGEGNFLGLYVDKLTEMSVEKIQIGHDYQATGILDLRDGNVLLYPRIQSDLQEIFPPALILTIDAPNTILPGEIFPVTLTATNHSQSLMEGLTITSSVPLSGGFVREVYDDGTLGANDVTWSIAKLEGNGGTLTVSFELYATGFEDQILIESQITSTTEGVEIIAPEPWGVFLGANLPIWAIQGEGSSSPYVLDDATTSGVVTGVFPALQGFFIQSTESDGKILTSDGLFVLMGDRSINVSQSDLVEVHGMIREIGQQTQIEIHNLEDIRVLREGLLLPQPVELDPPFDDLESQEYFESLEGMLVQVSEPARAISPTSRYGEYVVVREDLGVDRVWQGEPAGQMIMVDDGSSDVHEDRSTLDYTVTTGDLIEGLVGPLAYTYGRYKIEPLLMPSVTTYREIPEPLPKLEDGQFSLMTWNVENLFDILVPHPSDTPLPRKAEYDLALTKIANTILAVGSPTIIGLQEVEHIGILEDLVEHELLAELNYIPVLLEGTDSRGIDVGYLVREDQAELIDVQQYPAPEGITSRPPLLIQVQVETSTGSTMLYVINNHFTSMSGGELATEPRRTAQAAWNVSILEGVLADDPDANVVILGDLNSYYDSKPIDVLREASLRDVFDALNPDERYTYIYQGASQVLDHILVTPGLWEMLDDVRVYHANADFPPKNPGDSSPQHQSDHDPLIALFSIIP
jgi:predicted extracellular nuclease